MRVSERPLAVDLDGTLVRTDTLIEQIILLLKQNALLGLLLPVWLLGGKVYFKKQVAQRISLVVETLPYSLELMSYLRAERARGRELYLVTAATMPVAQAVANYVGLFSGVMASGVVNLAGSAKADALVKRFGEGKYVYAGNSRRDIPVWRRAAAGIVVNASPSVQRAAARVTKIEAVIARPKVSGAMVARLLRVHQWVKNILVFVPVVAAHALDWVHLGPTILAFGVFCLAASSVYVFNDLLDLTADREHPTKRYRPLAAGDVPLWVGLIVGPLLLLLAIWISTWLPFLFGGWLVSYLVLTLAYSFYLKRLVVVDVVILGLLYTIRILAGAAGISVVVSAWLFVFSLFLFMSLALLKRFCELVRLDTAKHVSLAGRGYQKIDMVPIGAMGITSGYIAGLVVALYISSAEITVLYSNPILLWLLVPLLLYWISRVWVLAWRNEIHDDPVLFAVRDQASYVVLILGLLIVWLAT